MCRCSLSSRMKSFASSGLPHFSQERPCLEQPSRAPPRHRVGALRPLSQLPHNDWLIHKATEGLPAGSRPALSIRALPSR